MATDLRITELPVAAALAGNEPFATVQSAVTVKTSLDDISVYVNSTTSSTGNYIVSGGGVAAVTGLDLTVSAATYVIAGVTYSSVETNLTAATADPTNPRFDVVAFTTSGTAILITGTPGVTPVRPTVESTTQLQNTFFEVAAATTTLPVSTTIIYSENVEYTTSQSAGHYNFDSTNDPRGGTKSIEGTTVTTGAYAQFAAPGTLDLNDYDNLVFYIKNKAAWDSTRTLLIRVLNAGVIVGVEVIVDDGFYGFSHSNTSSYQQIVIPASLFSAGGQVVNQIRIQPGGSGTALGFFIDDISWQSGFGTTIDNIGMNWRGDWNTNNFYEVNDVVIDGGIQYVAISPGVANTPASTPAAWQPSSAAPGAGTVSSVGLTAPAFLSVAGSPVATIGTLAVTLSGTALPVSSGGTGIISGTDGGILAFTASGVIASSTLLTNNAIVFGGGAGNPPDTPLDLGTSTQVLHGNASGTPNWSSVVLTTDVSGILPIANIATGTPNGTQFVRDDGTLAVPAGAGTVTSVAMTVPTFLSVGGSPVTGSGTLAVTLSGTALPVANGGTGLTAGTSGGIPAYTATGTITSSAALTDNVLMLGGGAGAVPTSLAAGLGTTSTLLHGNAAGEATWGAVRLTTDVSETLPVSSGGTGVATLTTYAPLFGGTTGTGAVQSGTVGTTGQVLTSNGAGALPTFQAISGTGTVTHTGGALTNNAVVLGAGSDDTKVVVGITTDGTSAVNLGVAGASIGKAVLANATSGTVTLQAVTGALGTSVVSIPAVTGTVLTTAAAVTVPQGGTGLTTLTTNNVMLGAGTSSPTFVAPGTSGNVLTSNGTTWTSAAAAGGAGTKTYGRFTPGEGYPPTTVYASYNTRVGTNVQVPVIEFYEAGLESYLWHGVMPEGASLGSGLSVRIHWWAATATTGNVQWEISFLRLTDDVDTASFDTVTEVQSATNATNGQETNSTVTCTTIDGVTAGDGYIMKIKRITASGGEMAGIAQLFFVEVRSAA